MIRSRVRCAANVQSQSEEGMDDIRPGKRLTYADLPPIDDVTTVALHEDFPSALWISLHRY